MTHRGPCFHQDLGDFAVSFRPALEAALAGTPLTRKLLSHPYGAWSKQNIRKIRNAVCARHGRPFTSKDLQDFFYGPEGPDRWGDFMHKPAQKPAGYNDSLLTLADKANIMLIKQVEQEPSRGRHQ